MIFLTSGDTEGATIGIKKSSYNQLACAQDEDSTVVGVTSIRLGTRSWKHSANGRRETIARTFSEKPSENGDRREPDAFSKTDTKPG